MNTLQMHDDALTEQNVVMKYLEVITDKLSFKIHC